MVATDPFFGASCTNSNWYAVSGSFFGGPLNSAVFRSSVRFWAACLALPLSLRTFFFLGLTFGLAALFLAFFAAVFLPDFLELLVVDVRLVEGRPLGAFGLPTGFLDRPAAYVLRWASKYEGKTKSWRERDRCRLVAHVQATRRAELVESRVNVSLEVGSSFWDTVRRRGNEAVMMTME